MDVILLQDVKALGKKGEIVKVSDGYARNFILPKKLGLEANAKNLNDLKLQKAAQAKLEKEQLEAAQALGAQISGSTVVLRIKTGENTFGPAYAKIKKSITIHPRIQEAIQKVYDYTIHDRSDQVKTIDPTRVLVIDGIMVLAEPKLREMMDIKIFVDTDADIRILRRIRRDVNERGRSLDSVIDQYISTVKPMHEMYVEPSKKYADLIIPVGGHNLVAMEMIENRVRTHLF